MLTGKVIAVAGAGGPAGRATLAHLVRAGATVAGADANAERLAAAVEEANATGGPGRAAGKRVDLLDHAATRRWADGLAAGYGRVDGLVHLVGGWRGGKELTDTALEDWSMLHDLLVRTVQHTSLAFAEDLRASADGRFVLVSAAGTAKPTAGNAAYAAAKAAAEAWTLALADSFAPEPELTPPAAATILVVKALVDPAMRERQPHRKFPGFTDVSYLAERIADLWGQPTSELNGQHLWLT